MILCGNHYWDQQKKKTNFSVKYLFSISHYARQVKKNLINVSYHIAQYTNIISDLRCEIQRLKKKIADQASRQLNSDRADIRHVQGKALSTLLRCMKNTF